MGSGIGGSTGGAGSRGGSACGGAGSSTTRAARLDRWARCAAPSAIACLGLASTITGRLKALPTSSPTNGVRVDPPTSRIAWTSVTATPHSSSAAQVAAIVSSSGGGEIIARQRVSPADGRDLFLDLEGIAAAPEGGFWLATEGSDDAPSALLLVDADAVVQRTVPLPAAISDRTGSAVSGLAVVEGDDGRAQFVYVAFRDAPRVARYEPAADDWTTASLTVEADTLQIGGLTGLADGRLVMVATDGLPIHQGQLRQLLVVDPTAVAWSGDAASEERLPLAADLVDISPTLAAATLYSSEWLDGITSTAEGSVVIVSDNAGVRRRPGETVFLDLGPAGDLF